MARPKTFDPEAILDRAIALFQQQGYHGSSLSLMVEHLGINRASLYDTYGDKEGLYVRALQRYANLNAAPEMDAPKAKDNVQAGLEATLARCMANKKARGCLMLKAAAESGPEAAQDVVKKFVQGWERWFKKALDSSKRSARSAKRNSKDDAKYLMGQVHALHGMSVLSTDKKAPAALIEQAVALVG
jgi:TetR/AcrR family transcriptional repressor of nem operon